MASNDLFLLPGAVLLSVVLAVAAVAADSVGDNYECRAGVAFPHNPLATCKAYVLSRACRRGPGLSMLAKEKCCRELAVVREQCRCEALRIFMDGVRAEGGRVVEGQLGGLRDCPREVQKGFAATLVTAAECNLRTISGDTWCYWLIGPSSGQVLKRSSSRIVE